MHTGQLERINIRERNGLDTPLKPRNQKSCQDGEFLRWFVCPANAHPSTCRAHWAESLELKPDSSTTGADLYSHLTRMKSVGTGSAPSKNSAKSKLLSW